MRVLSDFLPSELAEHLAPLGVSGREARRIYAHHVHHGRRDWEVRDLARHKRARVAEVVALGALEVVERRLSPVDGFTKYLFRLHDGLRVEAVRIPLFEDKFTVCISSQA